MIDTLFVTQRQLDSMKDYIERNNKKWYITSKLMSSLPSCPDQVLWYVQVEGKMDETDAFHFGYFVAKLESEK
jgi:hypothetical protein